MIAVLKNYIYAPNLKTLNLNFFMALHIPLAVAYITPSPCLTFAVWHTLKACHQPYTIRSTIKSQSGKMRPWEVYSHIILHHSSSPIIALWLCSPRTDWWVMCCIYDRSGLTSPAHLLWSPLCLLLQRSNERPSLVYWGNVPSVVWLS